jgi:hypothetical protein
MDNLRAFDEAADYAADDEPSIEAPPEIGADERRMHVRAYNYWVSLLGGRAYPSIKDLEPANLDDFGPHSVLLDFSAGSENPAIAYIGRALREECDLGGDITHINEVPSRSLLSRLTDHYLQIIANCAPIGFEAEFVSQRGLNTMYRGILMPLSSDGEAIDFIYGVINWKELVDTNMAATIAREASAAAVSSHVPASPIWADGPNAGPSADASLIHTPPFPDPDANIGLELGVQFHEDDDRQQAFPEIAFDAEAGLADRLCVARETAEAVKSADVRSRSALYRALGEAYDFALAADDHPDDYAELLEDAGVTAQARAPMTPVVKLIFGVGYDKTRLTEFAAALSYARRQALPQGSLSDYLNRFDGGLKGIVQAERRARRPAAVQDRGEEARKLLRAAPALGHIDAVAGDDEFVLLIARREDDGRLAVIASVAADAALLDKAIRKSA